MHSSFCVVLLDVVQLLKLNKEINK
uniref:Uncharacterized protein n=1 Tax=Anguilla anguilla TaxID=7936 RepID=A0A0E9QSE7_ANGAN